MPTTITLTMEQYGALVELARAGTASADGRRRIDAFVQDIDRTNDVQRYTLQVRWQDPGQPLPMGVSFPDVWPPELQTMITRTDRPIARTDVTDAVGKLSTRPLNILVTSDPGGLVGWSTLDAWFVA
jgi:hypothetical protein